MILQKKIQADLTAIPIGTEKEKRELLKTLLSEIKLKKGSEPSDEDVLAIVRKFKSNAIECGNQSEIPILDAYLPSMATSEFTQAYIQALINVEQLTSVKDIMLNIKNGPFNTKIDKKIASEIAKQLLT